jgi:HK97 family phage major capsid protein
MQSRKNLAGLREERAGLAERMVAIVRDAEAEGRDLTRDEVAEYDRTEARFDVITKQLKDAGPTPRGNARMVGGAAARGIMDDATGTPRTDVRGRALGAIERLNTMPDGARQALTVSVERDDDPENKLARWVNVASTKAYRSAFFRLMRDPMNGHREFTPEELSAYRAVQSEARALGLGSQGGGYMVPVEVDPQILIAGAGSADPMRKIARVTQSAENVKRFITTVGATASWDPEATQVSDDSPTLLGPEITCYKGQAWVPTSWEHADDSDIAEQIGQVLLDSKAQLEATAFTLGSGSAEPKGIITALVAAGGSTVIATGSNVLATADMYANQAALPARWRANAKWMMNLSILNGYRQLPQATGLNYSIVNDDGPLPRALGWDIHENSIMDGALTGAGNDYSLLSGDFQQYAIVDRVGAEISFVPHVFGANQRPTSQVGWLLRWRTGGDVLIPDAFRLSNFNT